MSAVLPEPVALVLPEENASALSDVAASLTGAVHRFGALGTSLSDPATSAPGWLGDDAAAAAAQVRTTAGVVHDVREAMGRALDRLRRHTELLDETRHRIAALQAQQEEDYGAAAARLAAAALHPATPGGPTQPALIVALGEELQVAEAARQRQHAALLDDLRSDALDTAHTLTACTMVVGGTGRRGDGSRVVAHLAVQLPGWGDGELSARGAALAAALTGPATLDEIETLAERNSAYAGVPSFADALLSCLGPDGLRYLFSTLGQQPMGADDPLAGLLAAAVGAARPSGGLIDPVGEVLGARYVQPDDPDGGEDVVVLGMTAVLLAGAGRPGGGVPATTVARWGAQILEREQRQGRSAPEAVPSSRAVPDPLSTVVGLLDDAEDPTAAAVLLARPSAWSALFARNWDDFGAVSRLVDLAGAAPGAAGDAAARSGLEALGAGLSRAGADAFGVVLRTADHLALPLGRLAAGHLGVVTGLLQEVGTADRLHGADDVAVRGLGFLVSHRAAEQAVTHALRAWGAEAPDPAYASMAAATLGSFSGVRQYGERLAYALAGAQAEAAAVDREFTFDVIASPLRAMKGLAGDAVGAATDLLAHWIGADGTWTLGPDRGESFTQTDAAFSALTTVVARDPGTAATVADVARASFRRTMAALGTPRPPVPEKWSDVVLDDATWGMPGAVREMLKEGLRYVKD